MNEGMNGEMNEWRWVNGWGMDGCRDELMDRWVKGTIGELGRWMVG